MERPEVVREAGGLGIFARKLRLGSHFLVIEIDENDTAAGPTAAAPQMECLPVKRWNVFLLRKSVLAYRRPSRSGPSKLAVRHLCCTCNEKRPSLYSLWCSLALQGNKEAKAKTDSSKFRPPDQAADEALIAAQNFFSFHLPPF